jgi:glycosyltransferase involved in cell wall biosynthesis
MPFPCDFNAAVEPVAPVAAAAAPANRSGAARRRIVVAVSRMSIGGVQRVVLETLARADRQGFDYRVLCTKKEGQWDDKVRGLDIPISCQRTLPPWHPWRILLLARHLRRLRPALVHIHMAPLVIPVATACRLAGVKHYLVHWHNNYERFWMEQQNAFLRAWERRLTLGAGAILSVSRPAAVANARVMGVPLDRVQVVPNGIDVEQWRSATPVDPRPAWRLPPETPIVVHVSRFLNTKRIEDFIEAAGRVIARWPGAIQGRPAPPPAFVVLGDGPQPYRRLYESKIEEVKRAVPGARVWLEGGRNDLPSILPCAQVGVLASENEGCPLTILEYMSVGLPMAVSSIPAIAELVRDGQTALFFPPGRVDAQADAIERLLLDPALAARLGEACRREAPQYDWAYAIAAYERAYAVMLGDGAASGERHGVA